MIGRKKGCLKVLSGSKVIVWNVFVNVLTHFIGLFNIITENSVNFFYFNFFFLIQLTFHVFQINSLDIAVLGSQCQMCQDIFTFLCVWVSLLKDEYMCIVLKWRYTCACEHSIKKITMCNKYSCLLQFICFRWIHSDQRMSQSPPKPACPQNLKSSCFL